MNNIKFVFIINDEEKNALSFLSAHKHDYKYIAFDTNIAYSDINFQNLLSYNQYYRFDKYLFFDGCVFGDTNEISGKLLASKLSTFIQQICQSKGWDIGWVFIRIADYANKTQTIDNLLSDYESGENKERRKAETGVDTTPVIKFMNFGETIILNKCFIDSRYALFGGNVPHEAINCFKTDIGERYFYLCSSGVLKDCYFERDNNRLKLPMELINKEKITYFDYSKIGKDDDNATKYIFLRKVNGVIPLDCAFDKTIDAEKYRNINYGEKNIVDIFQSNAYSRDDEDESIANQDNIDNAVKVYATFKAENENVFIPSNINEALVDDDLSERMKGSAMHRFVIQGSSLFEKIRSKSELITWQQENANTIKEYIDSDGYKNDCIPESILNLIDRTTRETYYSDIIAYVFSKSTFILNKFLEKSGVSLRVNNGLYVVQRESKNVDIFIKNKEANNKFTIVIENKIDANFNVEERNEWSHFIKKKDHNIINDLEEEKRQYITENTRDGFITNNQLLKYYLLARYLMAKEDIPNDGNHLKCLLICPQRNIQTYETKKNNCAYGDKYDVKSYSLIYDAIKEVLEGNLDSSLKEEDIEIINEIRKSLYVHTLETNVLFVSKCKSRFAKRIDPHL